MSASRPPLNGAGQLSVALVAVVGSSVVLHALHSLATAETHILWFVLAGLTLLSGSFTVRVPAIPARLSVSETFVFTAALLFGPSAATVIVVLDTLIISLWLRRASRRLSRVLFNTSAPAISIWVASHVFFAVAQIEPLSVEAQPVLSLVLPLFLLALIYFLLNSGLIAVAVGLEQKTSPFMVWRQNFMWLSLNYFSGASVAALLLPYFQAAAIGDLSNELWLVASILLPLLLISYLTFKTALGRVDDANRHLTELNRLYLSTIETLAMAIDAKDQITHGHIRRVQAQAVRLATEMGVTDTALVRAIEAAALLHDMGKLAVPEYILNKPGPLTAAEFEKMKLHASAGADILSAIEFPYPVVPIVRHHHENWDGSGYPDGLSGADIPIGARILSVVDCFDALTSDRPYRPRLSDRDALGILLNRRGSMYDPLAVDAFLRLHTESPGDPVSTQAAATALQPHRPGGAAAADYAALAPLENIAGSSEETLTILTLSRELSASTDIHRTADIVSSHLRRLIPCSLTILYLYNGDQDELFAVRCSGDDADLVSRIRIPLGERLSGWVGANRMTIRNSDPILDFGESVKGLNPRPRSCMSTPVMAADRLIGVLSLYSPARDAFSDEHQRVFEVIARQIAPAVGQSYESHRAHVSPLQDPVTGLPYFVPRYPDPAPSRGRTNAPFSLILLQVQHLDAIGQAEGRHVQDAILHAVVRVARRSLRSDDMLFRHEGPCFVALLHHTDYVAATEISSRLREAVLLERNALRFGSHIHIMVSVSSTARDGISPADLLRVAAARQPSASADSHMDPDNGPTSIH